MGESSIGVVLFGHCADENVKLHDLISAIYNGTAECPVCGGKLPENYVPTNREWLSSLSTVELVNWIKNTAAAMSDAELLKWLEEKHEYR